MWVFNEGEVISIPEGCYGFVYKITNTETNKQYIGKKLFYSSKQRQVKGKKKKFKVESDWREYYGSNEQLLADVEILGKDKFKREILRFCKNKGESSYYEAMYQFELGVLLFPEKFYNTWIMCKIHRKHLQLTDAG
jgi:hypothetical protein